jgi:hypothetical protein
LASSPLVLQEDEALLVPEEAAEDAETLYNEAEEAVPEAEQDLEDEYVLIRRCNPFVFPICRTRFGVGFGRFGFRRFGQFGHFGRFIRFGKFGRLGRFGRFGHRRHGIIA